MAEDALPPPAFQFFNTANSPAIMDENALRNASQRLFNETAFDNAFERLGSAIEAVGAAALRKAGDPDDGPRGDTFEFSEGSDFML